MTPAKACKIRLKDDGRGASNANQNTTANEPTQQIGEDSDA
jgi:hypothetical protein